MILVHRRATAPINAFAGVSFYQPLAAFSSHLLLSYITMINGEKEMDPQLSEIAF